MNFDIRRISPKLCMNLFEQYHGYGGANTTCTYCFGVFEKNKCIAAFIWNPPSYGCAKDVCPQLPQAVLSLSRMVAVPKCERILQHISKPLRYQMKYMIDRTRWPVLVTYSDSSLGHNGHVYKCSGWQPTKAHSTPNYIDNNGKRCSSQSNDGRANKLIRVGHSIKQRWEHWINNKDDAIKNWYDNWDIVPTKGKTWRSGNQAYHITSKKQCTLFENIKMV